MDKNKDTFNSLTGYSNLIQTKTFDLNIALNYT